ncbi:MAG TPA: DUF411 domain-containing protein [Gemmatimonadaceae bacterium]|nr:DUF411 domain-containing protein [Gemmatimonadaceae bacterium]
MNKRFLRPFALGLSVVALALTTGAAPVSPIVSPKTPTITVYKDPGCGCCKNWIEHLIKHGYRVDAKDTPGMTEVKRTLGVPDRLSACHTAVVNGYLIEGHVPAADIARLLKEKPKVAGLAVPGMPMGSPGMEGPRAQHYQVLSFDKAGKTKVFASD